MSKLASRKGRWKVSPWSIAPSVPSSLARKRSAPAARAQRGAVEVEPDHVRAALERAEAVAPLAAARVEQRLAGAEPKPLEIDGEQHAASPRSTSTRSRGGVPPLEHALDARARRAPHRLGARRIREHVLDRGGQRRGVARRHQPAGLAVGPDHLGQRARGVRDHGQPAGHRLAGGEAEALEEGRHHRRARGRVLRHQLGDLEHAVGAAPRARSSRWRRISRITSPSSGIRPSTILSVISLGSRASASSRVPIPFLRSSVRPTKSRSVCLRVPGTGRNSSLSVPL